MRSASGVTYLHGDHPSTSLRTSLGSTSVTSGGSSSAQTYYPYGSVRTTQGTIPTDYTFTGQKVDASAGLMYYGARYYDAAIGRFIQADTIVPNPHNPQHLNRYTYVYNNPLRYTDPSGHGSPWDDLWTWVAQAFQALVNLPRQARFNACAQTVDPNCGRVPFTTSIPDFVKEAKKGLTPRATFGPPIDPAILKSVERAASVAERLTALNKLFGPPRERVEQSFEYATSSRGRQLDRFVETYFPGLKEQMDFVYGGNLGEGRPGRFCEAGEDCFGVVYSRDTMVIGETAFKGGAEEVGVTIFHEQLEQLRAQDKVTHEEIYRLENLWREWYTQAE